MTKTGDVIAQEHGAEGVTYQLRYVNCGKCPRRHGPYWYAFWKDGDRTRSRYVGKELSPEKCAGVEELAAKRVICRDGRHPRDRAG